MSRELDLDQAFERMTEKMRAQDAIGGYKDYTDYHLSIISFFLHDIAQSLRVIRRK